MLTRRALLASSLVVLASRSFARGGLTTRSSNTLLILLASGGASPSLTYDFGTLPNVGDVIQWFDGVTLLGTHNINQTDINNGTISGGLTPLGSGAHAISITQTRGAVILASNIVRFTV